MSDRFRTLLTVYDRESGPGVKVLSALLAPAGALYGGAMSLRRAAYSLGFFSVLHAPCGVVSVGALTAGGSGKTQVVAYLSGELRRRGVAGAVVHGAYGGAVRARGTVVRVSPGDDPALCGDEAVLLASAGGLPVYAGPARYEACVRAHAETGAAVCILDDAAQHLRIARDWSILVVDPDDPFGNGRCLPAGPLREPARAGIHAHAVWFVTHRPDRAAAPPAAEFLGINPDLRVVSSVAVPTAFDLPAGGEIPAASAEGARVLAFCGIGRPHRFFETVRSLGPAAIETLAFPDHHPFSEADTAAVAAVARNVDADLIVTTAKDHARSAKVLGRAFPYAVLRVALEIVSGRDVVEEIVALKVPARRVSPR